MCTFYLQGLLHSKILSTKNVSVLSMQEVSNALSSDTLYTGQGEDSDCRQKIRKIRPLLAQCLLSLYIIHRLIYYEVRKATWDRTQDIFPTFRVFYYTGCLLALFGGTIAPSSSCQSQQSTSLWIKATFTPKIRSLE